ncbi:hypothetical protein GDO86_011473 [Hymenochirus boettgeri]|uniref:Uncharacterized protein n=1 Tax=Hymenochirus boettgeri TaxID=247094 RepID=A0A8T2JEF9_9PIPI|nr:hypothetical protein GDO86_011473 [Hymenochirus boettgeri]
MGKRPKGGTEKDPKTPLHSLKQKGLGEFFRGGAEDLEARNGRRHSSNLGSSAHTPTGAPRPATTETGQSGPPTRRTPGPSE